MNEDCQTIQELMPQFVLGLVPRTEGDAVWRHVGRCRACRAYWEGLCADEALLTGYVDSMRSSVSRLEATVIGSLTAARSNGERGGAQSGGPPAGRRIARWVAAGAAAAVVVLAIGLWPRNNGIGTVYAMSDVPRLMRRADAIHIKRYMRIREALRSPGDEHVGDWRTEDWIDMTRRRLLTHSFSYTVWSGQGAERPRLVRLGSVLDGRYRMQINHSLKRVQFDKLSEFQALWSARRAVDDFLQRVSLTPDQLAGFVLVGQERVDGVRCEIWQRQRPIVAQNAVVRTQYWLSPASGRLRRVREWVRDEKGSGEWVMRFEEEVEFDAVPPEHVFATTVPPGYRQNKSKEEASVSELIARPIRFGDVKGAIAVIIVLPDSTAVVGWWLDVPGWAARVASLKPGQRLAPTPLEIECRVTAEADSQGIVCVGRHLASTARDGRAYEWDIHVPDRRVMGPVALRQCHLLMRPHTADGEVMEPPEEEFSLMGKALAIDEDEFDLFVRGAMAELSDDGAAPDHMTYDFVRQLVDSRSEPVPESLVTDAVSPTVPRTPAEEPQASPPPKDEVDDEEDLLTAEADGGDGPTGCIQDEQGRPMAETTVLLYHKRNRYGLGNRVVEQLQTDRQGRYVLTTSTEFARYAEHAYAQDAYILIAIHPDYAFAWQNIRPGQDHSGYDLTLTTAATRVITVTDHDDNPLPNARVWLYSAGDRKSHSPLFRDYLSLPTDVGFVGGTTDASGHAIVTNLPKTKCSFHATLDGYATGLAFSGQNRIRLSPGADVSGWVQTDAGEPVGGAVVRLKTGWMWNYFLAESDNAGHFAFVDLPARGWDMSPWGDKEGASGAYTVSVGHPDYAAPETSIELLPGQAIDDLVLTVSTETALVRCLVLEEGTDAPVAGARISGTTDTGPIDGFSDANGVFTMPVLSGAVSLRFYSPPDGVYTLPEEASGDYRVKFEATPGEMEVTLRAPPIAGRLVSVGGTMHDPGGLPVSNAVVYAGAGRFETATATAYVRPAGADTNGRFELKEVPAGRDLHVYAESEDRMLALAAVVHIPADANESKPLELVLQPTATAVTVIKGKDGTPSANTDLSMSPVVQTERIWPAERRGRTDHAGILRIEGIVPGLTYRLRDARLEDSRRYPREEWEKWLDREITLIPLDR